MNTDRIKSKIVNCEAPLEVIQALNNFRLKNTEFRHNNAFLNNYFLFYLHNPYFLTRKDILLYKKFPGKTRNNFGFRLKEDNYNFLVRLSIGNIRTVKDQALHFIYSVYKYITYDPFYDDITPFNPIEIDNF